MTGISRREFGSLVLAGVPLAAGPFRLRRGAPLLGVTTSSFRELRRIHGRDNLDDVIAALRRVGAVHIELALANVEPAPPSVAPFMGGTPAYPQLIIPTPEEVAATFGMARNELREWRLQAGPAVFDAARRKIEAAGLVVHGCSVAFDQSFPDEELDATLREVKALGASTVSSPLTQEMAVRLAPFAARHGITIAIQNRETGNPQAHLSAANVRQALALDTSFKLKLDVGAITASNGDAVEELGELQDRVAYVVLTDRLRNGGRSQPFGEGDTPIGAVLRQLAAAPRPIPALVEYDYIGLRPAVEELAATLDALQPYSGS